MDEGYTEFINQAKRVKAAQVASYDGTDRTTDDVCPAIYVSITEPIKLEAIAIAPQIDRDMGLSIARILALALRPESITFMADSHVANDMINPATGKQWAPGEMQNACDVEGACSVGTLDDCLMFTTVWRDSERARTDCFVYTVDKGTGVGGSSIRWEGYGDAVRSMDTEEMADASLSGLVPDTLREALRDESNAALLAVVADAMGLAPHEAFVHGVVGAFKALGMGGVPVLVQTDDTFLMERLTDSLTTEEV